MGRSFPVFIDEHAFEALNAPGQELRNFSEPGEGQIFTLAQVAVQQFASGAPIGLPILPTSLNPLLASSEFSIAALKRESGRLGQPSIPGRGSYTDHLGELIIPP